MKLLFDQNLSFRLCKTLSDVFPSSEHVGLLGLSEADDLAVWTHARDGGFCLVSQDADFADLALLRGAPPKLIWLRCGNRPTAYMASLLRGHRSAISAFAENESAVCLEIY
jgi:predicted nuclease of predicted toxin-antitoxin system